MHNQKPKTGDPECCVCKADLSDELFHIVVIFRPRPQAVQVGTMCERCHAKARKALGLDELEAPQ